MALEPSQRGIGAVPDNAPSQDAAFIINRKSMMY
jgi:hypothetical protein